MWRTNKSFLDPKCIFGQHVLQEQNFFSGRPFKSFESYLDRRWKIVSILIDIHSRVTKDFSNFNVMRNEPVECPRKRISAHLLVRRMDRFCSPWLVRPAVGCERNCNLGCCSVKLLLKLCMLPAIEDIKTRLAMNVWGSLSQCHLELQVTNKQ